jgi:hypothetical protein
MNIHVFNWKNFKFNPLRPPRGCDPLDWMQVFIDVFDQAYFLRAGGESILSEHINRLYTMYGVFEGKDTYPTLLDLKESIDTYVPERNYGKIRDFLESVKVRLKDCIIPLRNMFDCDRGFPLEDLLLKPVIFEFDSLLYRHQKFLVTLILRFIYQYRISNKHRGSLEHVIFFDEGKMEYGRKEELIQDLGPTEMTQITTLIREFCEALVVCDQMPTDLSNAIKGSVYTTICMSQVGGENITSMARAMNLNKEQIDYMTQLVSDKDQNLFEAIVKMSGRWLKPFVIEVLPFHFKKSVTDYEVNLKMRPLIEELKRKTVPRTAYSQVLQNRRREPEAKRKEAEGRRKEAEEQGKGAEKVRREQFEREEPIEGNILIRILNNIMDHPFIAQKERITMLKLASSSSTNNKYFKELVAEGYVTKHSISFGKGRGSIVLYEITEKGKEFARMKDSGIQGKGDMEHKFWQHTIKEFYESLGSKAEIEKRYGMKNVDVGLNMEGKKVAIEIELTPKNLIENIHRDFEAGCEKIIVAVRSKASESSYKNKIKYYNEELLERIEFRILTDFLPEKDGKE